MTHRRSALVLAALLVVATPLLSLAESVPSVLRGTLGGIEHNGDPGCTHDTCWIYTAFKPIKRHRNVIGGITTTIYISTDATSRASESCFPVEITALRTMYPVDGGDVPSETCSIGGPGQLCRHGALVVGSWQSPDPNFHQSQTCSDAVGTLKAHIVGRRVSHSRIVMRLKPVD